MPRSRPPLGYSCRNRLARRLLWGLLVGGHLGLALWMASQPVALPSDDALFFARGLLHFSVLEFSPHFPGYPGLMVFGRAVLALLPDGLGQTPLERASYALAVVSMGAALLLPLVMAWIAGRLGGDRALAYGLGVTLPLLPGLGLALLSDSVGLLWSVVAVGLLASPPLKEQTCLTNGKTVGWAGVAWGIALACRPSYGPFLLFAACAAWLRSGRAGQPFFISFSTGTAAVLVPLFGGVFVLEGWSYAEEGWRFFQGHMQLWGQTALSNSSDHRPSWWQTLATIPPFGRYGAILWLAVVGASVGAALVGKHRSKAPVLVITWVAALVWTLAFQNPTHARHLAPVLTLLAVMMACASAGLGRWAGWGMVTVQAVLMAAALVLVPLLPAGLTVVERGRLPPLTAAMTAIDAFQRHRPPGSVMVVSNYGIALLRQGLPTVPVVDAYYQQDAASLQRTFSGCIVRLSSQAGDFSDPRTGGWLGLLGTFAGRAWGEPAMLLYGSANCVPVTDFVPVTSFVGVTSLLELATDLVSGSTQDALPVVWAGLTQKAHAVIPQAVLFGLEPTPIGPIGQQGKGGNA